MKADARGSENQALKRARFAHYHRPCQARAWPDRHPRVCLEYPFNRGVINDDAPAADAHRAIVSPAPPWVLGSGSRMTGLGERLALRLGSGGFFAGVAALAAALTPAGAALAGPLPEDAGRGFVSLWSEPGPHPQAGGQVIVIPPGPPTVATPPQSTQTPPELARADLVNRPGRVEVILPLKERTSYLGDVTAGVSPDGMFDLSRDRVITLLEPLASQATLDVLRSREDPLTLDDLRAAGLDAVYDPALLEIVVTVPVDNRQRRTIELFAGGDETQRGRFERPATPSAWLSWRTALDFVHEGDDTGWVDPAFDLSGAVRMPGGVVLEGDAFWDSSADNDDAFRRQSTRFVYDQSDRVRRWELGDLRPASRGFQASPDIAGLSLLKSYNLLQPGRNIRPRGEGAFSLRQPGAVEVFVNGRLVRRLDLDAGAYDVRNFPFTAGQNDVQFVVEDRTGRREVFAYNRFFDQTLLEPGLSEYQLAVGVAAPFREGEPDYDTRQGVATGFYRSGVTDAWTVGVNGQANEDGGMLGVESVWGAGVGVIGTQAAVSQIDGRGGWALQLDYQWQNNPLEGQRQSFGVFMQSLSPDFNTIRLMTNAAVTAPRSTNTTAAELSFTYSRELGTDTVLSADAGHVWGRDGQEDGGRARLGVSRSLDGTSSLTIEAQYNERDFRGEKFGVYLTFSRRLGFGQFLRASHETRDERSRMSYQRSPVRGYGDFAVTADLDRTPGDTVFNGSVYRAFNRVEATLAHIAAYDEQGNEIRTQRSSLRLAGAVAYADGAVAIGRPIYDSFAIVDRHRTLSAAEVLVEPTPDGGAQARTDAFGPALVSEVASYSRRTLAIGVEGADPGYDLGTGSFDLLAPYRAGYLLTVGSDYSVSVLGVLVDRDLLPVALLAGRAIDLNDSEREPVELFTNRQGRFAAQGLRPGRWRIELGDVPLVYELVVPEGQTMLRLAEPLAPVRVER